jgi:hypothetical protein
VRNDFEVFVDRASVSTARRAVLAAQLLLPNAFGRQPRTERAPRCLPERV